MKTKILLVLPLLALAMSGCNKDNNTSHPYDDDDETSFPPGTMPEEPSSTGGSGSGGDIITSTDDGDVVITAIDGVLSYPEEFDIDEGLLTTDVVLKLALNNGNFIERHPESLDYNASPAQIGQLIVVTANYGTLSTTFQSKVITAPHDLFDVSVAETTSSTYKDWTYDSTFSDAKYMARTGGATDMTFSSSNKDTGIVSTYSGGRVKKIKIKWCAEEPQVSESSKPKLGVFLQTTPFYSNSDLIDFKAADAKMQLQWQEDTFVYEPTSGNDFFYVGFRALNGTPNISEISVYWDTSVDAPTLSSMAFTEDSSAFAETNYTEWDLSKVKVNGTFSDDTTVDITRFVNLSSTTTIPSEAFVSYDVSVTAVWGRDTSITFTDTVRGKVDVALTTNQSWQFENTVTGGAFTHTCVKDTDTAGKGFLADNVKEADGINYLQILSTTPLWSTSPSQITVQALIGGGSGKTFTSGHEVKVVLLDQNGDEIAASEKTLASVIVKEGSEHTVNLSATDNVYGVKIKHLREGTHKCRYYSFALRTIA